MKSNTSNVEILLIEDNLDDMQLTLYAFKRNNIVNPIEVITDGAMAIEYLSQAKCARLKLILLDLKLPKVDGIEILRHIRGDERLSGMPVVILTSSQEEIDLTEAYRLHVNSYIIKPLDFNQFSEAIRRIGFYWVVLNQVPVTA